MAWPGQKIMSCADVVRRGAGWRIVFSCARHALTPVAVEGASARPECTRPIVLPLACGRLRNSARLGSALAGPVRVPRCGSAFGARVGQQPVVVGALANSG